MKNSCVIGICVCAIASYFIAGCSSQTAPPKPPENPTVKNETESKHFIVLEPSLGCLAEPMSKFSEIPWQVARTLAEISKVTYDDDEDQISAIKKLGATAVRPITKGLSHGIVASDDKVVVIGFRGTKVAADWLTNTAIVGRHVGDGKIHRGFFQVVDAIYQEVFDEAIRQGAKEKKVWITGHSLGGAMAVVFAHRGSTESELAPEGIVTFGQPLAVSGSLAQFFLDKFDTRYIRFVNSWDAVPRLLPNYRHAGCRVYMKEGGYTFRPPVMAVSAPAPTAVPDGAEPPTGAASLDLVGEPETDLEPMTEEQFDAFQKQLQMESSPHVASAVGASAMGAISIPWYEAHLMSLYIDRIKEFGEKELNKR
jgi:hypothetical protein